MRASLLNLSCANVRNICERREYKLYLFDGILERTRHAGRIKRKESEKRFSFEAKEIWRSCDVGEDPGTGESNALKVHYRPLQRTEGKSRTERERERMGKGMQRRI